MPGPANRWLLLCLASLVPGGVHATWASLSETQLLARSELVVIGELIGHSEVVLSEGASALNLGVIRVDEVLKGPEGMSIAYLALPRAKGPAVSTDIHYRTGQQGLWYLRARGSGQGVYLADHPQRFVPATAASDRIRALRTLLKNSP